MHEDNNSDILLLLCQGMCGENTATVQGIGRDEQDDYAIQSYTRSQQAAKRGDFNNEIVPITVKSKKSCKYYVHIMVIRFSMHQISSLHGIADYLNNFLTLLSNFDSVQFPDIYISMSHHG